MQLEAPTDFRYRVVRITIPEISLLEKVTNMTWLVLLNTRMKEPKIEEILPLANGFAMMCSQFATWVATISAKNLPYLDILMSPGHHENYINILKTDYRNRGFDEAEIDKMRDQQAALLEKFQDAGYMQPGNVDPRLVQGAAKMAN